MDLDTSIDTALGDSDEEEGTEISQTRRNLLLAQLYDSGLVVHDDGDGKEDDVNNLLTSADGTNSMSNMAQDVNALTLSEMDDTFHKLRQWRERNSQLLEQGQSNEDSKDNANFGTTEVSWIKEILALVENDSITRRCSSSEGESALSNSGSSRSNTRDGDSEREHVFLSRANTLQKLQQLMSNLEEARGAQAQPMSSAACATAAFSTLARKLSEQNDRISRERVSATRPSVAQAQGRQQQRQRDLQSEVTLSAAGKDQDSKSGYGGAKHGSSGSSVSSAGALGKAKASSSSRSGSKDQTFPREAEVCCAHHTDKPARDHGSGHDHPETDEEEAGVATRGQRQDTTGAGAAAGDSDYVQDIGRFESRLDALINEDLDLHSGLDELGGQLASFMDDLDSLFPEEAQAK